MGELKSNIPNLVAERGISDREFEGMCYAKGLSLDTAKKLLEGKTNINMQTQLTVMEILNVDIGELFVKTNGSH